MNEQPHEQAAHQAFADDLKALAQQIEPEAAFAASLEARLREAHPANTRPPFAQPTLFDRQGDTTMNNTLPMHRIRPLAIAAAVVIVVLTATLTVPSLRTLAQDILNSLFNRATSDTQTYATPITYNVAPTPAAQAPYSPSLTLEQAAAQAGFAAQVPAHLPAGYTLVDVSYDAAIHSISLLYNRNGIGLNLVQTPAQYAEPLDVGASAKIEIVKIGDVTGEFVRGWWQADGQQSGDTVELNGRTWDNDYPFQQLRWIKEGKVFWLSTIIPQRSDLSLTEWLLIAESVR